MPAPAVTGAGRVGHGSGSGDQLETITKASFNQKVLNAPGRICVEFMSYGCGDCREAEPFVQKVAAELKGKVSMYRVIVPMQPDLVQQYGVRGTPTYVMFQGGREMGRAEWPDPSVAAIKNAILRAFG